MPSPFPGMNPYLERPGVWRGFHTQYLVEMQRALAAQVQPRYVVDTQESLFISPDPDDPPDGDAGGRGRRRQVAEGDVLVLEASPAAGSAGSANGHSSAAVMEAPVRAFIPDLATPPRHRWIEVRDGDDLGLVTLIELLSPANKRPGPDRDQYARKRARIVESGANLVELDLLRAGPRLPLDGLPPCDYYAMVARPDEWPEAGVWPVGLRDPLPTVPVPLRPPDADAALDLRALLHAVYDAAGYAHRLYRRDPNPPLSPDDRAWADRLLGSAGVGGGAG